jgi:hypothetical protein
MLSALHLLTLVLLFSRDTKQIPAALIQPPKEAKEPSPGAEARYKANPQGSP